MQFEARNATSTFFELSIHKSIDYIRSLVSQLFQMLFIVVSVILVGRALNLLIKKPQTVADDAEVENENDKESEEQSEEEEEVTNPDTSVENKENSVTESSRWESIPITTDQSVEPPDKKYALKKTNSAQYRRKAISVGPIMRCASSQVIKTLDFKDGEERYSYDLVNLDLDASDLTSAENVCVPKWHFHFKTMLRLSH